MPLAAEAAPQYTPGRPDLTVARSPGDLQVCRISGAGGAAIDFMEWLNGAKAFSHWDHVRVYLGNGMCLQAEPGGAEIVPLPAPQPGDLWSTGIPSLTLSEEQQARVPALAEEYRGIGYSWLDYAAIAAHRAHVPDLPLWPGVHPRRLITLREFIRSSRHYMCSALADSVRMRLGSHLFANRWEGFVTPFDIGALFLSLGAVPVT